jgi:16S rRNA (cytosine967-C5)-methyltransferase
MTALEKCLYSGRMDLQAALDSVLRSYELPKRDAGLATEIVYGLLRNRERVRFIVDHFLRDPKGIAPLVRRVMEIAAYEIVFLDKVPGYASVDWAVEAVKQAMGSKQAGLVNAVLRKIERLGTEAHEPAFYETQGSIQKFLSVYHSMPLWIVEMWLKDYGDEQTRMILEASAKAAPLGLRVNAGHGKAQEIQSKLQNAKGLLASAGNAFALSSAGDLDMENLERDGVLTRQSFAAQEIMQALGSEDWPRPIWDACAGRGGKTCLLLEQGPGEVWASDRNVKRLKGLRSELQRLALPDIPVFACDAAKPALKRRPQSILLDAPCSGFGTLSRRPDSKYKRSPADLDDLKALQRRMLKSAAELLPSGGVLIYITCTVNKAENEEPVAELLGERRDLREEKRFFTEKGDLLREFFFGAVLRKA